MRRGVYACLLIRGEVMPAFTFMKVIFLMGYWGGYGRKDRGIGS